MATRAKRKPKKTESTVLRLVVDGVSCEIDYADLELGEMAIAERYFDAPVTEVNFGGIRGTIMLAYLARRRVQPDYTLAQVEALRPSDIEEQPAEDPPTSPADNGAPPSE